MDSIELPRGARAGEIDHVPFGEDMDHAAVRQRQAGDPVGKHFGRRHFRAAGDPGVVDFRREVAGIGEDDIVFQQRNVLGAEDTAAAGDGDDEVGAGDRLVARGRVEAVEVGLQALQRDRDRTTLTLA